MSGIHVMSPEIVSGEGKHARQHGESINNLIMQRKCASSRREKLGYSGDARSEAVRGDC